MPLKLTKFESKSLNNGFTIVELLIVVAIIAILSGLILSSLNSVGIRAKARDNQRKADLKKIQTALELYYADKRQYPAVGSVRITGSDPLDALSSELQGYIWPVPVDPLNTGTEPTGCGNEGSYRYNYHALSTDADSYAEEYVLTAIMEVETSNDGDECPTGTYCSPDNTSNDFRNFCYAAVSP